MMIRKRFVRVIQGCCLLILIISFLGSCVTPINAKRTYARIERGEPFDVVIVPGLPYDTSDMPSLLKNRLYWAKLLYDSGITKNIIFSGSSVYTPFKEGVAMKIMADSIGIPSYRTFSETKAEHSTENLYYSWKMAREMGFKKIGLATDPFQMLLLKRYKRRYCKDVQLIPIHFKMVNWDEISLPEIDPQAAYVKDFVSIMHRESFWDRFRGTMGKRIKEDLKSESSVIDETSASNVATNPRRGN
jgi:uncharacterized SAM-binding protein YcdF (DUF218 family)